jgi:hypothetical protein
MTTGCLNCTPIHQACAATFFPAFLAAPLDLSSRFMTLIFNRFYSFIRERGVEQPEESVPSLPSLLGLNQPDIHFFTRDLLGHLLRIFFLPFFSAFRASLPLCLAVGPSVYLESLFFLVGVLRMAAAAGLAMPCMKASRLFLVSGSGLLVWWGWLTSLPAVASSRGEPAPGPVAISPGPAAACG